MDLNVTTIDPDVTDSSLDSVAILYAAELVHIPGIIIVNVFVLVTFRLVKELRTPDNYGIAFLATADLSNGAIAIPMSVISHVDEEFFNRSIGRCFVFVGPQSFVYAFPLSMLMLLTIERYVAICHPIWYSAHVTCKSITYVAMGICFVDFMLYVIGIGYVVFYKFDREPLKCTIKAAPKWLSYPGFMLHLVKLSISFLCTLRVAFVLWRSVKRCYVSGEKVCNDEQYREMKAKSIKMIILMFVFVILWVPTLMAGFYLTTNDANNFTALAGHMLCLNSTINPLVYAFTRKHYIKAFMYLVRHRPCVWGRLPEELRRLSIEEKKGKLKTSTYMAGTWRKSTLQQIFQEEEDVQEVEEVHQQQENQQQQPQNQQSQEQQTQEQQSQPPPQTLLTVPQPPKKRLSSKTIDSFDSFPSGSSDSSDYRSPPSSDDSG